jgi:hypothetical protein
MKLGTLFLLGVVACGGRENQTADDAGADVSYPVPYGGTWTTNSGCWFTVAPACGCHYDGDHLSTTSEHDYGLYCDGTVCVCYVDSHSTKAIEKTADVCVSTTHPASGTPLGDLWLGTCGFPATP